MVRKPRCQERAGGRPFGRNTEISNPQPNPQIVMSCTAYGYFGSPRRLVSCCKTNKRYSDKGEVGGSSPPRPTINPQCLCGHSRFCLSPEFPAKPFVNDLSTSGIAICRPRRHRRHHDLARGFTDCLNFLLTATAPRHSRNGKNTKVHSRHILDCGSPPSKTSVHRFEG